MQGISQGARCGAKRQKQKEAWGIEGFTRRRGAAALGAMGGLALHATHAQNGVVTGWDNEDG